MVSDRSPGGVILRREFLRMGMSSLSLPAFLALRDRATAARTGGSTGFGKAKSCIILFAWGGMSHFETFDPKPDAPIDIRGTFNPIATSVPGVRIGEHLPRLARQAHELAIVRSVHHDAPSHRSAAYWNLTGHAPQLPTGNWDVTRHDWPCLGSMISAGMASDRRGMLQQSGMPAAMAIPYELADGGKANGQDGGFLGPAHDPVIVRPSTGHEYEGVSPISGRVELALPDGMSGDRIEARRDLVAGLDPTDQSSDYLRAREQAFDMILSSSVRNAFDLKKEPPRIKARYGEHICGQSVLMARRLAEAGVPVTTVYCAAGDLNGSKGEHFDTHADNFNKLKDRMLPPLDQASSALLTDLRDRGTLDDTLVVWLTEFGRTPKINRAAGRDHYPNCYSVAFAGGGIRGGQVYGKSDWMGAEPAEAPCAPPDLHATIFHALGIDGATTIHDLDGRPLTLTDGKPLPLF